MNKHESIFSDGSPMTLKTKFMVVASGAGEYGNEFDVVWVEAQTPEEAARIAVAPHNGYGNKDGDVLYVCRTECVTRFVTAVKTVVEPVGDEGTRG
jgi:hypothetical protein